LSSSMPCVSTFIYVDILSVWTGKVKGEIPVRTNSVPCGKERQTTAQKQKAPSVLRRAFLLKYIMSREKNDVMLV
jgi:hypothetical protein